MPPFYHWGNAVNYILYPYRNHYKTHYARDGVDTWRPKVLYQPRWYAQDDETCQPISNDDQNDDQEVLPVFDVIRVSDQKGNGAWPG